MAALHHSFRQVGQIAQNRQAGLGLQQGFKHVVQLFGAVIEQNACEMAVFAEVHQTLNLSRQRHADPFGLHHQQHGQVQRIRQFPRAGPGGQALSVVKAHGTLAHGGTMPGGVAGIKGLRGVFGGEK